MVMLVLWLALLNGVGMELPLLFGVVAIIVFVIIISSSIIIIIITLCEG
jgi:hypothetical protein